MAVVKEGYKVSILFEAKLETGEIVLKTEEGKPLEVTVGEGTIMANWAELRSSFTMTETPTAHRNWWLTWTTKSSRRWRAAPFTTAYGCPMEPSAVLAITGTFR